jgi:CheY-like chemotaxis protein
VALANSGVQAITWLAKNTCDLILLDYAMPVTDGKKVLEMLKSEENTRDIPVMFLTGKNDKESIMEVLKLNPDDYLLKTIGRDALLEKMAEFFESREW